MPKAKYTKGADGYYFTSIKTDKIRKDGYPVYKKLRAKTIKELDEKLRAEEQKQLYNLDTTVLTVNEWYEQWFSAYKSDLAPATQNFYKNLYNRHIKEAIGSKKVIDIKEVHAQQILSDMANKGMAKKTVKGARSVLYSIFDKARANRLIPFNPCEHLTATGAPQKIRRALTEEERTTYLKACKEHEFGTFAAFLYFFGLRRGEALALTGADIYDGCIHISKQLTFPDNNQPHLSAPKTAAGIRNIPIPTKARFYINFNKLNNGFIFTNSSGKPLSYTETRRKWNSFLNYAFPDGTDLSEHYLRHNYCSMLFENDVDLLTVKTLAGHESVSTTLEIYTHYTESMQKSSSPKVLSIG